jgi:prophage regulatory protein
MTQRELTMRLIRLKEVMYITGLGRSSIYRFMSEDNFPQSISLGDRAIAWEENDINEWVLNKVEEKSAVSTDKAKRSKGRKITDDDVIKYIND